MIGIHFFTLLSNVFIDFCFVYIQRGYQNKMLTKILILYSIGYHYWSSWKTARINTSTFSVRKDALIVFKGVSIPSFSPTPSSLYQPPKYLRSSMTTFAMQLSYKDRPVQFLLHGKIKVPFRQ